jgi:TPR repeat protein
MYALGLGVERDVSRAFEWYLRASLKGHPGAQSGIGWYYETGLGLTAPDLIRAYMWYALSTIGGDPDAAISVDEVRKKMSAEQIEKAHVLIDDYRVWMYPFRERRDIRTAPFRFSSWNAYFMSIMRPASISASAAATAVVSASKITSPPSTFDLNQS